ncbi:glycoside hydrolase family 88 protein [Galbibacter sp. BG1]|uniref:glycoside hydrolase family 88 protein n=1 Tax=Galbibacter sp. BG1 TaxID=1170699 RepID=UPI0015BC642C|nr:glycoside hydrolase family 88 protein [Galbibacter sp. BG1]QLE02449.1 glycoside hydrolase family 88 protein [Galbibacter sp. BG1]
MDINTTLTISNLNKQLDEFWVLAKSKALLVESNYDKTKGAPVFTVEGKYTSRGWTEWTQGFQYGIPLLVANATKDEEMFELGKRNTVNNMAHHITHFGVHDHGFNNLSTYGNLLRMSNAELFESSEGERNFYKLAIQASGSVQSKRWTQIKDGGYMYSFNGPHSLFIDTIRTARILLAAHKLGHKMLDENDKEINLLDRAITHALTSAKYSVYYGEGRDQYDIRGRVSHEAIFNINDGNFRCPNSQQGFSGFTTWTRGLSWAMVGFPEFLEYLEHENIEIEEIESIKNNLIKAAKATCDFYISHTSKDGIPYWDTGAPTLHKLGDYTQRKADIYNEFEPIDSSAAAIGAQGLLRLGKLLENKDKNASNKYIQAGLSVLQTLLQDDYLATDKDHQGILKHSVYHWPNGWDHVQKGQKVPTDESSMWGDYHMVELCFLASQMAKDGYYTFFDTLTP